MGLAMVRGLARHQGGWVTVSSVVGVGTDFQVYLPLAGDNVELPELVAPPKDFQGLLHSVAPCTLLIVDDDAGVRHVISYVLKSQGHTVLAAKDAREAWQMWRSHRHCINLV